MLLLERTSGRVLELCGSVQEALPALPPELASVGPSLQEWHSLDTYRQCGVRELAGIPKKHRLSSLSIQPATR